MVTSQDFLVSSFRLNGIPLVGHTRRTINLCISPQTATRFCTSVPSCLGKRLDLFRHLCYQRTSEALGARLLKEVPRPLKSRNKSCAECSLLHPSTLLPRKCDYPLLDIMCTRASNEVRVCLHRLLSLLAGAVYPAYYVVTYPLVSLTAPQ